MKQSEIRAEVKRVASRSKTELRADLEDLLYPAGAGQVPENLKNQFLQDCYQRIEPEERPVDRAKLAAGYDTSWGDRQKKTLATALNLLLTERVGRDSSPILRQTTTLLAELVVAIRLADDGHSAEFTHMLPEPPKRTQSPASPFDEGLPLDDVAESELVDWVDRRRSVTDGPHAVYVLDCTPPTGEDEPHLSRRFRARVHETKQRGGSLSEKEALGDAVTGGQRIFYVGYATDVASRVQQHVTGVDGGGAQMTHTFPPQSLVEVTWYDSETEARQAEQTRAAELTDPGRYRSYFN